jgi:uncharacterized protein (DUF302 family)
MLIRTPTTRSVEELAERIPKACAEEKFGVLGTIDLRAKLKEKGQPYDRACVVFEVCRPDVARQVLETAPEISTALPCRISVFERADGTRELATIRPRDLLALVGPPGLESAADDVERSLRAIMEKAAR